MLLGSMSLESKATHLLGGYMNYEFINKLPNGDSRYLINFHVYRDQSGVELSDEISVGVYLNNPDKSLSQIVKMRINGRTTVPIPGSVQCPAYRASIDVQYGLYTGIVTLAPYTEGYHITYEVCCRNSQNNLTQAGATQDQGQTYYCFIPATAYENSSPAFDGVPSPYMCANDTTSFLFNAVDRDGDSLAYRFMRPFQGGSNGTPIPVPAANLDTTPYVSYRPGYSFLQPFGTAGYISIDNQTAYTQFLATEIGNYVVGVEVLEYRNGAFIGKIRMDLQIVVLTCPDNERPEISSDKGKRFEVEEGEELCFTVRTSDPDGDRVFLSGKGGLFGQGGGIPGESVTFRDTTGKPAVSQEFCWTPSCDAARSLPYIVYFETRDDGCPEKKNSLDVLIDVKDFVGADLLTGPSDVCSSSEESYALTTGKNSSTYEWEVTEGTIISLSTVFAVDISWTGTGIGRVRAREVNTGGCFGDWKEMDVTIRESPSLPVISGKDTVCVDELNLSYSTTNTASSSYYWETINATIATQNRNSIQLAAYSMPDFTVRVAETNAFGCTSDTADYEVFVIEPTPDITGPTTVCPNSLGVAYKAEGLASSTYTWSIVGGSQVTGGNSSSITVNWEDEGLGSVTVIENNRFGCIGNPVTLNVDKTYILELPIIDGLDEVCEFDLNLPYTVTDISGSSFDWTITGGVQTAGTNTASILATWGTAGAGNVSVIQRAFDPVNSRLCVSDPANLPIKIYPKPTADEIIGDMEVCQLGDSVQYTINGFAGSTFEWRINGDVADVLGQGTRAIKLVWKTAGTMTLSVLETSPAGCPGELVDTLVLVNPKPTTTPILGPATICPESSNNHEYSVIGSATSSFIWEVLGSNDWRGNGTSSITVDWDVTLASGSLYVLETSDKGCLGDTQRLAVEIDRLALDMRYISVGTPDNQMIVDWQLEVPADVTDFTIQRKIAGANGSEWQSVNTVSGSTFNFTETGINTDISAYDYRVVATNKCGTLITSEMHTSILLTGIQDEDFNSILEFTEYSGWDNGVSIYDLWLEDNVRNLAIERAGVGPQRSIVVSHDPDQYRKCFRIKADEQDGESTSSWSNEICFFFSPTIYVPNAFTPNGDNLNDGFGVRGIAINEFNIQIYNRWGEKIFQTTDINKKWYPVYRGKNIPMGTYVYLITFTDYENKAFKKTGTINLIR